MNPIWTKSGTAIVLQLHLVSHSRSAVFTRRHSLDLSQVGDPLLRLVIEWSRSQDKDRSIRQSAGSRPTSDRKYTHTFLHRYMTISFLRDETCDRRKGRRTKGLEKVTTPGATSRICQSSVSEESA